VKWQDDALSGASRSDLVLPTYLSLKLGRRRSAVTVGVKTEPRMNSAVVPLFRGLAAACVVQAVIQRVPLAETVVLVATAIAASVDLGPAAARQLMSAANAKKKSPGAAAEKWARVVSIKVVGQLVGLVTCAFGAALQGALCIIAADAIFWLAGGGEVRFGMGGPDPIPDKLCRVLFCVNAAIFLATLAAIASPGLQRTAGTAVYTLGVLAQTVGNEKTRKKQEAYTGALER
jgi:hypothetical protein